jgi:protein-disulfide isomerase
MKPVILPHEQTLGCPGALLQLICYGDYLCPASREVHFTVSQLLAVFEGKLLYAFRPFPHLQNHPFSLLVARAVEAAGRQDAYWPMHYALFRYRVALDLDSLYSIADALGLDGVQFDRDLLDPVLTGQILHCVEEGRGYRVGAAPALFINGVRELDTALWQAQERLERLLTTWAIGKAVGTVDPLLGTVNWGAWPGL